MSESQRSRPLWGNAVVLLLVVVGLVIAWPLRLRIGYLFIGAGMVLDVSQMIWVRVPRQARFSRAPRR